MPWEERRIKLAKLLVAQDVDNATSVAEFLMKNQFDYVPEIAARATAEVLRRNKEKLGVSFD